MDTNANLLQWFMNFFYQTSFGANTSRGGGGVKKIKIIQKKRTISPNQLLSEGLHNSIIIRFGKKVHLLYRDNVWDANLADM